jgi:hypothetical protein
METGFRKMERIRAALQAIKRDPSRAEQILEEGLQQDRAGFVGGLAAFVTAALDGVVIDPDAL